MKTAIQHVSRVLVVSCICAVATTLMPSLAAANQPTNADRQEAADKRLLALADPPIELTDPNYSDEPIAYAYRLYDTNYTGVSRPSIPILFAPGFDVNAEESSDPEAGSDDSLLNSIRSLQTNRFFVTIQINGTDYQWPARSYVDYLVTELGYEVYVVDYADKRAAVQQNSVAVQKLIKSSLAPFSDTSIRTFAFGYSMGGLIVRHALLELENSGSNNGISAYVSLDAPHRGAYLPPSLEVSTRTLQTLADDGSAQILLRPVEKAARRAKGIFDSPGARQLLGIYVGRAVPDENSGLWGGATADRRRNEEHYKNMEANHHLAVHSDFYDLRRELALLGGYPKNTLNIGVSFGSSDGTRIRNFETSDTATSWKINQGSHQIARSIFRTNSSSELCYISVAGRNGRTCPRLDFSRSGQFLEGVLTAPGSQVTVFQDVHDGVLLQDSRTSGDSGALMSFVFKWDPILLSDIEDTKVTAYMNPDEEYVTFIPTVSAFDDKEWAYTYLHGGSLASLDTPFDEVIAGPSGVPSGHNMILKSVSDSVLQRLIDRGADIGYQTRTGSGGPLASGLNSSYFDSSGDFNVSRYVGLQSPREIPVVDDSFPKSTVPLPFFPPHRIGAIAASL